jgi:hypothetical protein
MSESVKFSPYEISSILVPGSVFLIVFYVPFCAMLRALGFPLTKNEFENGLVLLVSAFVIGHLVNALRQFLFRIFLAGRCAPLCDDRNILTVRQSNFVWSRWPRPTTTRNQIQVRNEIEFLARKISPRMNELVNQMALFENLILVPRRALQNRTPVGTSKPHARAGDVGSRLATWVPCPSWFAHSRLTRGGGSYCRAAG